MDLLTGLMMASIVVLIAFILTGINTFTFILLPLVAGMYYYTNKSIDETLQREGEF